jgi:hypothetical protein
MINLKATEATIGYSAEYENEKLEKAIVKAE